MRGSHRNNIWDIFKCAICIYLIYSNPIFNIDVILWTSTKHLAWAAWHNYNTFQRDNASGREKHSNSNCSAKFTQSPLSEFDFNANREI